MSQMKKIVAKKIGAASMPSSPLHSSFTHSSKKMDQASCLGPTSLYRLTIYRILIFTKSHPTRFCHTPDGSTSPKYKLLCFITTKKICKEKNTLAFNRDMCCHLVLCLQLIPFHSHTCSRSLSHSRATERCLITQCSSNHVT
jgi:hypothetical protein